jgi:hypothetical protein
MEAPRTDPAALEEAIRCYAELEAATKTFTAPGQGIFRGAIANWSIWSRRQASS